MSLNAKLFESIKKCSEKLHFSNLLFKYKYNIKKTWEVTDEDLIAKQFNTFFTEIGIKLAKTIQASSLNFTSFRENCNSKQAQK